MKNLLILVVLTALLVSEVISTPLEYNSENYGLGMLVNSSNTGSNINEDNLETIIVISEMIVNQYWLFTRKNPTIPQIIVEGDVSSISNSYYDARKPLKVIAHGWGRDGYAESNTMVTSAFLETYDVNVIVLDWRVAANGDYLSVASRVPATGRALGNFIEWLFEHGGGNWKNLHLVGYSFGAHIMGNVERGLRRRPTRVTGLDPAGPFWSGNPYALNAAAGQYVEVIHTNIMYGGITEPIGHTDFYPNGGHAQPGCGNDHACAHARSFHLFSSSIRTDHFIARRCSSLLQAILNICSGREFNMGNGNMDKNGRGIYALTTGSSWPF